MNNQGLHRLLQLRDDVYRTEKGIRLLYHWKPHYDGNRIWHNQNFLAISPIVLTILHTTVVVFYLLKRGRSR